MPYYAYADAPSSDGSRFAWPQSINALAFLYQISRHDVHSGSKFVFIDILYAH